MHRNTVTTGLALKSQASTGALGLSLWDQRVFVVSFRYTFNDSTAHIAFSLCYFCAMKTKPFYCVWGTLFWNGFFRRLAGPWKPFWTVMKPEMLPFLLAWPLAVIEALPDGWMLTWSSKLAWSMKLLVRTSANWLMARRKTLGRKGQMRRAVLCLWRCFPTYSGRRTETPGLGWESQ